MKTLKIGTVSIAGPLVLGPMAGVTDTVYRQLCKEQGCHLLYTEMVSAKAILYKNKNIDYENLSKNIYPIIGKRYNKSANTIYCDIKQAVKAMYYDCEEETINEYFHYSYFMKPKLKEIIFTILRKI